MAETNDSGTDHMYNGDADEDGWVAVSRSVITDHVPLKEWLRTMKLSSSQTSIESTKELKPGDHILHSTEVGLGTYHHAIVADILDEVSKVHVVHVNPPPGTIREGIEAWMHNEVRVRRDEVDLTRFFQNGSVHRVDYTFPEKCFTEEDVIARARDKEGRRRVSRSVNDGYDLMENNCEHFATWCKTGHAFSIQTGKLQVKDDED